MISLNKFNEGGKDKLDEHIKNHIKLKEGK